MMPPDDVEHATLVRDLQAALRRETPQGLSLAQREAIEREAAAHARRPRAIPPWLRVACALLLITPAAAYYGIIQPEVQRISAERAAEQRIAAERAIEAQRFQQEAETRLKRALEDEAKRAAVVQAVEAAEAQRRLDIQKQATKDGNGKAYCARSRPCGSAGKAGGKAASKAGAAGASGACDPNDPLCGL